MQPDRAEILKLKINIHYGILEPFSVCFLLTLWILLAGFTSASIQDTWPNSTASMFGVQMAGSLHFGKGLFALYP